jgi:hypothetical protein
MIHSLMTDTLRNNPPEWLWPEEVEDLPNPAIDKRELWEMVATCTPGALISAHYSSLTLRLVADWLQHRIEQADANGWTYEPDRMINDLRVAAMAADLAIESAGSTGGPEYMPRHPSDTQ